MHSVRLQSTTLPSTPSRLQSEKSTTKNDDYGNGHRWLAMVELVSERQQCRDTTVRAERDPTRTAASSRYWWAIEFVDIVEFLVAII